jgi:hypothetical protein
MRIFDNAQFGPLVMPALTASLASELHHSRIFRLEVDSLQQDSRYSIQIKGLCLGMI